MKKKIKNQIKISQLFANIHFLKNVNKMKIEN